jgi:hypothetical protein
MKVPLTSIYTNLDFASDRISTQVRTLAVGVLAVVWLFLSGSKDVAALNLSAGKRQLLTVAGLCVLTLLIDAVHYVASYLSSNAVRKAAEKANKTEAEYDVNSAMRRVQETCFWAKQITSVLATAWLLVIIVRSINT